MRRLAVVALCFLPVAAWAAGGSDIDSIPQSFPPPPETAASSLASNLYLQSDLTLRTPRHDLVVPLAPPSDWETRLFFDARLTWRIDDALSFSYSGRINLRAENGLDTPDHENIRNDLREAYFSWQAGPGLFLQLGRINLRSGVAEGFNPTDYFKTRAVVEPTSADPTVLREDRLGTVMLLGQKIWSSGALSLAVAPKLASDSPPYLDTNLPSFDPALDRTNAHTRFLIKTSFHLLDDVNPELLVYDEAGQSRLGANVTKGIGEATIVYAEWSGGRRASLVEEAFRDGFDNGILPSTPPIPVSTARTFANDLAIGTSYATKIGINIDLEYDYHQAGFSSADWRNWFDGGSSTDPALPGELWYLRGYAGDQQEPMARHSLFLRADWQNAFVRDLTLASFVDTDLRDGSGLAQFTADYYFSPTWTVGGLVDIDYGRPHSDFGSLPGQANLLIKLSHYF